MNQPRYNHAFTIAFEVHTDNPAAAVTAEELYAGIERRLALLREQDARHSHWPASEYSPEILEACGRPYDTSGDEDDEDDEQNTEDNQ